MDLGYRAEDILWLVEHGLLTLGYQSSSYLTARVPELGFVDQPFLFAGNAQARAAIDGGLGEYLARQIEERVNYRILGYFENGFRHISNRLRPVRAPADMKAMRIRVLPSDVQKRTFELLGAIPMRMDLTEAIEMIKAGTIDAQENPFANTVTYGVHKFHHFHTVTNHFYISRPIFVHRPTFDAWPKDLQEAMRKAAAAAVAMQRGLAVEEDKAARQAILAQGCEILELTEDEHAALCRGRPAAAFRRLARPMDRRCSTCCRRPQRNKSTKGRGDRCRGNAGPISRKRLLAGGRLRRCSIPEPSVELRVEPCSVGPVPGSPQPTHHCSRGMAGSMPEGPQTARSLFGKGLHQGRGVHVLAKRQLTVPRTRRSETRSPPK